MSGSFSVTYQGMNYFCTCDNIEEAQDVDVGQKEFKIITHWPSDNIALTFGMNFSRRMKNLANKKVTPSCCYFVLYTHGSPIKEMILHNKKSILEHFQKTVGIQGQTCHTFHNYETAVQFIAAVNDTYTWMVQHKYRIVDDWTSKADWNEYLNNLTMTVTVKVA